MNHRNTSLRSICKTLLGGLACLSLLVLINLNLGCASGAKKTTKESKTTKAASTTSSASTTTAATTNEPMPTEAERTTKCVYNKDARDLWLEKKDGNGCILKYRKFGETSTLGESDVDASYCRKMQAKVVGNLTTAGFTCQAGTEPTEETKSQ